MKALNELKDLLWEPEDDDVCTADGGAMIEICVMPMDICYPGLPAIGCDYLPEPSRPRQNYCE